VSLLAWLLLSALYLVLLWTIGITTFRKGHYVMFFVGIVFPVAWIVGAVIPPTPAATAGGATGSPR
jgi:hypothetical protein